MTRTRSLSGQWAFALDPDGTLAPGDVQFTHQITVPLPWQAAFPDLQRVSSIAWYQRTFEVDATWLSGEVLLTFGAVDYLCDVYLNGQYAGGHEGGYTPFTLPVRALLRQGRNDLRVRVYDPIQQEIGYQRHPQYPLEPEGQQPPGAQSIPHGKQEWYVNVGGLWQDVTLRAVSERWIAQVHVTAMLDGTVVAKVQFGGLPSSRPLLAEVLWQGEPVATASALASDGAATLTLRVPDPHWWSPEHPDLYVLLVKLGDEERRVRFGFRTIETRDGRLLLNGEPFYLVGALDQDFYRETIYTPPSEDYLRDQFQKAKEMGLNCLRCHIKVPDPRYLDLADEMGLLVWAEIPSWRTFYPKGLYHDEQTSLDTGVRNRVEQTLREMIARDFNHPCIIIWTMVNEDWGTMLPLSASDRVWVRSLYNLCKHLDPARLVVDNSACPTPWGANLHVQSDLDDWHMYTNIPDAADGFVAMVEQLSLRPLWSYSSYGDSARHGDEPLIVSEFGNWGLAQVRPYLNADGSEPGWFDLGPWWSGFDGEPGWMRGVLDRFDRLGLSAIFGDFDAFATATQWHQFQAMKFEIEAMRRQSAIQGYIITEFTDCYWESNGLLDFDRRPKVYYDRLREFNAEDILVPELRQAAAAAGETLDLRIYGSHFTARDWAGASLTVALDGHSETVPAPSVPRANVQLISQTALPLPSVERAEVKTVHLRLTAGDSTGITVTSADVLVLPQSALEATYTQAVAVIQPSGTWGDEAPRTLEHALRAVGYAAQPALDGAALAVSAHPTPELMAWVRGGGDLLFLCNGLSPFFWVTGRGGTYSGNWMSCWSWLRPGVHRRLGHPELNPLKLPFVHVMPRHTILGLPVEDASLQPDFLAGQITGWVNHPAVHTVQFRYGTGRVLMTTFALEGALGKDPVATALLHDLVDWLSSERCAPNLRSNW